MGFDKLWDSIGEASSSLRGIGAIAGLAAFTAQGGYYAYVKLMPMSNWMTYHSMVVGPTKPAGQSFSVSSFASFKKPVDIDYTDVLQCIDETGEFVNFSSQPFSIDSHYPPSDPDVEPVSRSIDTQSSDEDVYVSPWRYTEAVPAYTATCRIRGIQEISLAFGIKKRSVIITNTFEFVDDSDE